MSIPIHWLVDSIFCVEDMKRALHNAKVITQITMSWFRTTEPTRDKLCIESHCEYQQTQEVLLKMIEGMKKKPRVINLAERCYVPSEKVPKGTKIGWRMYYQSSWKACWQQSTGKIWSRRPKPAKNQSMQNSYLVLLNGQWWMNRLGWLTHGKLDVENWMVRKQIRECVRLLEYLVELWDTSHFWPTGSATIHSHWTIQPNVQIFCHNWWRKLWYIHEKITRNKAKSLWYHVLQPGHARDHQCTTLGHLAMWCHAVSQGCGATSSRGRHRLRWPDILQVPVQCTWFISQLLPSS